CGAVVAGDLGEAFGGAGRAVHRHRAVGPGGCVVQVHLEGGGVDHVVGVQVRQQYRVERAGVDEPHELAEGAGAEVEHDRGDPAIPFGLHEVTRGGGLGSGDGAGAADDGELHRA